MSQAIFEAMSRVVSGRDLPAEPNGGDGLLHGRIRLRQPRRGYRVAIDTAFLAAAVPAAAGDCIADLGTGVGGAALCLAARVPGASVAGLDVEPAFLDLARENVALNAMHGRITVIGGDVCDPPPEFTAGAFDHVMANPPYMKARGADPSPDELKARATVEGRATLNYWVEAASAAVAEGGTITFVHRADRAAELLKLLEWRAGDIVLCPLWPKEGQDAKRVLVQARKGAGGAIRFAAGLVLHRDDGRFTREAEAVLAGGGLDLAGL